VCVCFVGVGRRFGACALTCASRRRLSAFPVICQRFHHPQPSRAHADSVDGEEPPRFDQETAFKVLRSAGYAAHALCVAERAGQPEWVLDVLLEDMGSYAEAIAFVGACCAVLYCAVLCCAVLCHAVPCCAVLCCAVLCHAVPCCAVPCCAVLCCAVPYCAVLCCAVLCCAVLCCAVLCCAVLCVCTGMVVWCACSVSMHVHG
jgi:hypothetical protein